MTCFGNGLTKISTLTICGTIKGIVQLTSTDAKGESMKRAYLRNNEGLLIIWHVETLKGKLVTPNGHSLRRTDDVVDLRGWPDDKARVYNITEQGVKIGEMLIPD